MGSPLSVVVAEIVMQNIDEQALVTYRETLPLWLRYVDDTITALHKNKIDEFHEHLNKQNTSIQFTREIEENGKIPFLDCWVIRKNNTLRAIVCRKPTHSDRVLDQTSYNPTSHKATAVRTLTRRAQIVCDSHNSLTDKTKHLNTVFILFYYRKKNKTKQKQKQKKQKKKTTTTTTAQTSSNAILTSDRTTALTTHTPPQPLYLTYEGHSKPFHTTTLQHPSCTQIHVHYTTLTH